MYIFRVVIMLFSTLQNEKDVDARYVFMEDILPRNTSWPYDELV
jgi:hypothetical protein